MIDATGFRLSSLSADLGAGLSAARQVWVPSCKLVYNPDSRLHRALPTAIPANVQTTCTVAKAMAIKPGATYVFDLSY